jgi:DNA transposition AAA+ family ATPase
MTDTATLTAPEHGTAVAAMHARRFKIPGDVVNRATAELPDHQRSALRWLHAHGAENDYTLAELGRKIRYDETTVYRVFYGKYEGRIDNVVAEIESLRKLTEERAKSRKLDFIETALAKKIWRVCEAALEFQRLAFIFGDSQIGKSTALKRYAADHNHGSTIYMSIPTGGALSHFLDALAVALRISPQQKDKELRRRILGAFDDRMLLIVDEAHQALLTKRTINPLEFVRELHDARGCGVVLAGTNVFRDGIETGSLAPLLKQTRRRRLVGLQLPNAPAAKDLNAFAAAYGLPPASGESLQLQTSVIRDEALGMWLTLLRMASKLAAKQQKKLVWAHVQQAHAGLQTLEKE